MSNARTLANTINSSSQIVVPSGGVNFGTATDGTGTVTSGILDDYEEGTWTPNIFGGSTTGTFSGSSNGVYTKIGNLVIASGYAGVTGMTGAGYLRLSLPFTSAANAFKDPKVQAVAAAVHTQEIKDAYTAHLAAQEVA